MYLAILCGTFHIHLVFDSVRHSAQHSKLYFMLLHTICFYYTRTQCVCACVFRYEFHMFRLFISVNRPNLTFGSFIGFETFFFIWKSNNDLYLRLPLFELLLLLLLLPLLLPCDSIRAHKTYISFHFISCGTHILSACEYNNKTEWAQAHTHNTHIESK